MPADTEALQSRLGYRFADQDLLRRALTHRSHGARNNERLEFLGDSALNHVVAEALYHRLRDAGEGELTRARACLVRRETLSAVARELGLGEWLRLGPAVGGAGGAGDSTLADGLEAVLGAVLLDGGMARCRELALELLGSRMAAIAETPVGKDGKTLLQELLQARGHSLPGYRVERVEGAEHCPRFHVRCELPELGIAAAGQGGSRRQAEQEAAGKALRALEDRA